MALIKCEINLILTWPANCVISFCTATNQTARLATTDAKLYVPVVSLSTDDYVKLLQKLKSGF